MFEFHEPGIAFLTSRLRSFLADEAGLGKSRQMLLAAEGKTLIIAPAMVLDGETWDEEIAKWRPDLDVTQISYSSIIARKKGPKGGPVPTRMLKPEFAGYWDTVIADECHHLKGRGTTWAIAAHKLKAGRLMLATGTPIPNWAHELFMLLQLLRPEDAKPGGYLGSYWRWIKEWFRFEYKPWAEQLTGDLLACTKECKGQRECEHWNRFYEVNLGDLMIRRLRDDVMDQLPPLTEQWIKCPMTKPQAKVYREVARDFTSWVDEADFRITAWNSADQTNKLAQIATGIEILDPRGTAIGSGVLDRYREEIRSRQRPTLVAAHYRSTVEAAARIAESEGFKVSVCMGGSRAQSGQAVRDFKSGKTDVIVATIDKIREGLNLQRADCAIMLERSYSPYKNEQVIRRLHRGGQERPVTVLHLVSKNTIHERVIRVAEGKTDNQIRALRPAEVRSLA